jgi:hypothetical protein
MKKGLPPAQAFNDLTDLKNRIAMARAVRPQTRAGVIPFDVNTASAIASRPTPSSDLAALKARLATTRAAQKPTSSTQPQIRGGSIPK